ncbi:MAG: hypothetical protein R2821_01835 [Flavobacteriaceae bacterium]|jgi:hypothetical protein
MKQFLWLALQANNADVIKEKIENAPDKSYEIGIFIGTYLPLVVLIVIAYVLYFRMKKRKDLED